MRYFVCAAVLLAFSPVCSPASGVVTFVDVTTEVGLDFTHSYGDSDFSNLIEAIGAGVSWLDYDGDGWMDVYLVTGKYKQGLSEGQTTGHSPLNRLYRNRGDGTFEDVTRKAGVGCDDCYSMGVVVGDYDNDGWSDIYVTNYGRNVLYHNNGNGTFSDVTARSGTGNADCSVAASWFDFDRDGLLDLYVGNYIDYNPDYKIYYSPDGFPGPLAYAAQADVLYRNRGDGTFEDISRKVGLAQMGRTMSVAIADYDGDSYDDIYVTNDGTENYLYRNINGTKVEEVALLTGVAFNGMADQTASMAVDFGDFDGNGTMDIFVSDNAFSSLYQNDGKQFLDISSQAGIARPSAQFVGWGAFFFDYDNDGDLDIFKANSDLSRLFGQEDQIFENRGKGKYRDVSTGMGPYFQAEYMGRGAAYADYDNDGDLDIIISNIASRAVLLRNEGGNQKNAVTLMLVGTESNRDGLGTKLKLISNGNTQFTQKRSSAGYISQNDPRIFFGIGNATVVDRIEISWPSGRTQVLEKLVPGKTIIVEEPAGKAL